MKIWLDGGTGLYLYYNANVSTLRGFMKNHQFQIRMDDKRMDKSRLYGRAKGKTMTQVIEKLIDSLAEIVIKATEQEEMFLHFTQN